MKRFGAFLRKLLLGDETDLVIVCDEKVFETENFMKHYLGIAKVRLSYSRVVRTSIVDYSRKVDIGYNVEADVYLEGHRKPLIYTLPFIHSDSDSDVVAEALDWVAARVEEILIENQRKAG